MRGTDTRDNLVLAKSPGYTGAFVSLFWVKTTLKGEWNPDIIQVGVERSGPLKYIHHSHDIIGKSINKLHIKTLYLVQLIPVLAVVAFCQENAAAFYNFQLF
jgi:hypothetical protein